MKISRKSPLTGQTNVMDIDVTQEQLDAYERRVDLAQNIFPDITPDEREFIISGCTPGDWDVLFPPEDE